MTDEQHYLYCRADRGCLANPFFPRIALSATKQRSPLPFGADNDRKTAKEIRGQLASRAGCLPRPSKTKTRSPKRRPEECERPVRGARGGHSGPSPKGPLCTRCLSSGEFSPSKHGNSRATARRLDAYASNGGNGQVPTGASNGGNGQVPTAMAPPIASSSATYRS